MKALIASYKRGRHVIHHNQAVILVQGVNDKKSAAKLIGSKVSYKTTGGKSIKGVVKDVHGDKGRVRARFERGLPGQAIGSPVEFKK